MIGKQILHYRILEKLGEGGMGVVYLAEDTKLERMVAIKFLPSHISSNAEERKRFEIEAKAAAALNHPNIATIYAIEESDNQIFLTMEYIRGRELKELIRDKPLKTETILDYASQIAAGLNEAHDNGILHRDIKSSNIMVSDNGRIKIMDFGLAKVRGGVDLTKKQSTMGTAAYMSPEQARGDEVDHRSDLWSLGVVLYEMMTGSLPFKGDYDQAVIYSILNDDPLPPSTVNTGIPDALNEVVMHLLMKNLNDRTSSAAVVTPVLNNLISPGDVDPSSLLTLLKKPKVLILLVLALVIPAVFYLISIPAWQSKQSPAAQLSEIRQAAESGEYIRAYELARRAENSLRNDSTFQALQSVFTNDLTILSSPAGAKVYLKAFRGDPGSGKQTEEYIGSTPIHKLSKARDDYFVRVEKDGFIPVERIASGEFRRLGDRTSSNRDVMLSVNLSPAGAIPENMVSVPGGRYKLVGAGAPTAQIIELDSFLIDKYETSNLEYKKFILSGRYNDRSYWKYPIEKNGKDLTWQEAMRLFVDRSGLPGPRNWVNQEFPAGQENHPVTGVSWYEAAAYAEFAGKSLPTVFEWEKASRNGLSSAFGSVMPWGPARPGQSINHRANFNGEGSLPVSGFEFGISPYGCFNMSGNVKEWCSNQITGGYVVTGGSWQDPVYMFAQYGALDGFFSSPALGFRCVKRAVDVAGNPGAFRIDLDKGTPVYQPVDEKTFRTFLNYYKYDKKPVETKVIGISETADWIREKRTFRGPRDENVIVYMYLPRRAAKPYQCLFYVPGVGVFMGRNVATGAEFTLGPHIKSGRAVMTVVLKGATEREWGPERTPPATYSVQFREEMVLHATEIRMGIDYLESRDDIDMQKFAYVGLSWGAGSRLGFSAIDERFRAVVFIGAGIDERVKPTLPEADNVNFAPYIKPPKLIVNGKYDEEHNWYTRGLPLYNLLREPKEFALLEGGHMPSVEERTPVINAWLDKILGPVRFEKNPIQ